MKNTRYILLLSLVVAIGACVMARVDWQREKKVRMAETVRTGERLVGLLALYPLRDTDPGALNLLAKSLVEQSTGKGVAYLRVQDAEGEPLLSVGDQANHVPPEISLSALTATGPLTQRFSLPDGAGDILEFAKPLIQARGKAGMIRLGLRVAAPALPSADRVSFIAAIAFFMLAAMIFGYVAILHAARQLGRKQSLTDAGDDALIAPRTAGGENILATIRLLDESLTEARLRLRETMDRLAELSSSLGVAAFEKEQAYRVLDGLDFGILILDAQERIHHVNRPMLALLGVRREDIRGRSCAEAIRDENILAVVENRISGVNGSHSSLETRFEERAPGRFFRLVCRPVLDSMGDSIGNMITAEDITRARLAEKAQDDFIAQVAHELFTPLTAMKSHAEMLATGEVEDSELQKQFFNTINDETDRLTALIRNLLSVAKMDVGTLTLERAMVRTDWLLDQCLPSVEATARSKRITITKRLPDTFPTIMGDKDLLKVVLVNLLGNAVKYTPEGGTVRISLFEQNDAILFEVADTGFGISQEDLPHVFEKFYRGAGAAIRDQPGSGLGLATALQIAKLHGGGIDVSSEVGKGSCFTVRIPAEVFTLEKR